jgi:hypothetical protein
MWVISLNHSLVTYATLSPVAIALSKKVKQHALIHSHLSTSYFNTIASLSRLPFFGPGGWFFLTNEWVRALFF